MQTLNNESYFVLLLLLDLPVPFLTPLGVQIHKHSIILQSFFFFFWREKKNRKVYLIGHLAFSVVFFVTRRSSSFMSHWIIHILTFVNT